jgi:ABC-2 type transport system permease protein
LFFYPIAFVLGVPFLVIPACLGALATMLISAFLPARRTRTFSLVLLVAGIGATIIVVKLMGLRSMLFKGNLQDISQIMALLNIGSLPLVPNYWLARGMQAASEQRYPETIYWFLCLLSTAMMSVQVCLWLVPRLYYRGWVLAKECASATYAGVRRSAFQWFDRLLSPFSPPVRALLGKDMRTFWRDPAQWSQLIILFGLLAIYIANIRGMQRQLRGLDLFLRQWPTIVSFFNMGATCFVLSILTTRFIYPMLSLEGKQYWVVGLAPFPKRKLVWEKYGICAVGAISIAVTLMVFSNHMLNVSPTLAFLGLTTIVVLGFGLTSLSVGLGATYPNFREDNPARIANGLGGTINIILSLTYITCNIALELPFALYVLNLSDSQSFPFQHWRLIVGQTWPILVGLFLLNIFVIVVPMRVGIRRWHLHEFHL